MYLFGLRDFELVDCILYFVCDEFVQQLYCQMLMLHCCWFDGKKEKTKKHIFFVVVLLPNGGELGENVNQKLKYQNVGAKPILKK